MKGNRITLKLARVRMETGEPFDVSFWKKNGDIVEAKGVVCTSSYFEKNTFNLLFPNGEFRKVRAWNIFNLNGKEVCI